MKQINVVRFESTNKTLTKNTISFWTRNYTTCREHELCIFEERYVYIIYNFEAFLSHDSPTHSLTIVDDSSYYSSSSSIGTVPSDVASDFLRSIPYTSDVISDFIPYTIPRNAIEVPITFDFRLCYVLGFVAARTVFEAPITLILKPESWGLPASYCTHRLSLD